MGGRALAVAGLALGLFTLVIETPLMVMVSLPAATRAREQQHRVQCADNVKAMGAALIAYAETHGNSYPAQLDDVTELSPPPPAGVFVCPSDRKTPPASAPPESMAADINSGEHCSYVYVGTGVKTSADPRVVILYEPLGNHNREGMNVLFADGQCKWLNADEAQSILDQRAKGKRPIRVE
jgi:prepilin-type processing-associated H-X9-DG protein